jgi:zinc transport system substrate-binding protein
VSCISDLHNDFNNQGDLKSSRLALDAMGMAGPHWGMRNCLLTVSGVLFLSALPSLPAEVLRVGVSVLPLEPLVKAVGGDAVEVRSLQREGDSCSVFEPRPSAISWLAEARIFFRVGAGYESVILEKVSSRFPGLQVDDLREAVATIAAGDHAVHDHGEHACEHCQGHAGDATDPHIWLDPLRLAEMATRIADRLGEALPERKEAFAEAAGALAARLMTVHAVLEAELTPFEGRSFYIYHPALGYFADRYGLKQVTIAGSSQGPGIRELHTLVSEARHDGVKTIFIQPQESRKHAEIVADAIGATLVEIDPMATDLEGNLAKVGRALAESFAKD